jgi:hypothetical protein
MNDLNRKLDFTRLSEILFDDKWIIEKRIQACSLLASLNDSIKRDLESELNGEQKWLVEAQTFIERFHYGTNK